MGKVKLWWHPASPPCRAVRWYLDWSGLAYEVVHVDVARGDLRTEAFLTLNPLGQVPVIEHAKDKGGSFVLSESTAILEYLRSLKANEMDGSFSAKLAEYFALHHSLVRDISIACVAPVLSADPADRAEVAAEGKVRIEDVLQRFTKVLSQQKYILSDELSVADFLFATELDQLYAAGIYRHAGGTLATYLKRVGKETGYTASYTLLVEALKGHTL